MSEVKLGVSQLVWGFDLSRPDRLVRFLDDASAIGYQGVLLFDTTAQFWFNRPRELKAMLDRRNLRLVGVILRPHLDFAMTDRLTKFMAAAGAEVMNISGRDGTKAEWDIVIPALRRHAEIAHANGIRAVYQHHTGWIVEDEEDYERLLRETDRAYFGVMTDCGHATKDFKKSSAAEFIRKHPELDYIELKDWTPQTDLNTEVGRGLCDWPAVADAIRAIDYKGWVVVEQNSSFRPAKVSAAESYHYVKAVMGL